MPTSWDEVFADRYDEWSAHMTEDVAFYVDLAREADGPIVELAVGDGRVAVPVALDTGRRSGETAGQLGAARTMRRCRVQRPG